MCGRFAQSSETNRYAQMYGARAFNVYAPRYNIAPATDVLVCRWYRRKERELVPLRWGLVPGWAKTLSSSFSMINARAETITEKPAYKEAFRRRRCLIPADGFYEWQGTASPKQPYYIARKDGMPFSFAGVWDHWEGEGKRISSCAIICTGANGLLAPIHERMPVIVRPEDHERWLSPAAEASELLPLLVPYTGDDLVAYPVDKAVNDPKNDFPELIRQAG